jgi:predicted helicase
MMKHHLQSHLPARRQQLARWCRRSRSFTTLEARLASLPTPSERGAMFELFAEAYLATMPLPGATAVWPQNQTPESLRAQYRAALERDCGIDGLFQTKLGPTHAYQVKFRQNRAALTWSELATFVGLSEEFPGRLIFTNAWGIGELVAGRRGVYAVTGRELDALNAEQLHQIAAHLAGRVVRRKRIKPLPHQQEALAATVPVSYKTNLNSSPRLASCKRSATSMIRASNAPVIGRLMVIILASGCRPQPPQWRPSTAIW